MRRKTIFLSEEYLKENSPIAPATSSEVIYFTTWTTQEEKILPALGTALYKRLIEGIENPTDLTKKLNEDEKILLDEYILPALMFYVLAELPEELTFKTSNKGLTTKGASQEGSDIPSMTDIARVVKRYTSKGDFRLEACINFLREKSASNGRYSQYINPGTGVDTILPAKTGFRCPINISAYRSDLRRGYNNEIKIQ
jgi:hypothetical protein